MSKKNVQEIFHDGKIEDGRNQTENISETSTKKNLKKLHSTSLRKYHCKRKINFSHLKKTIPKIIKNDDKIEEKYLFEDLEFIDPSLVQNKVLINDHGNTFNINYTLNRDIKTWTKHENKCKSLNSKTDQPGMNIVSNQNNSYVKMDKYMDKNIIIKKEKDVIISKSIKKPVIANIVSDELNKQTKPKQKEIIKTKLSILKAITKDSLKNSTINSIYDEQKEEEKRLLKLIIEKKKRVKEND